MDFLIFIALQVADTVTTLKILDKGGRELNPLLAKLFEKYHPVAVLLTMKFLLILCVMLADDWRVTLGLSIVYAGVVAFNIRQMRK